MHHVEQHFLAPADGVAHRGEARGAVVRHGEAQGAVVEKQANNTQSIQKGFGGPAHRRTWTKAIFVRDPATRFLSAFTFKCVTPVEDKGKSCKQMFWSRRILASSMLVTFSPFLSHTFAAD